MTENRPIVSVGMPVYNGERYLEAAIESILGQTFEDLELIISDNASTDSTEAICRKYAAKDPRVRCYRNAKNLGATKNWNAVFRHARGKYFKWASCNDLCHPRFIETCVKVLDEHPDVVLVCPRTRIIRADSRIVEDYEDRMNLTQERPSDRFQTFVEQIRLNNVMNGIIRPDVLRKTPLHVTYLASDIVLMAELTLHGKFVEVPEFMFFRRMDSSSAIIMRDMEAIKRHYDPEMTGPMFFQRWKLHHGYLSAVLRTSLPFLERVRICRFLWRRFWRDRSCLVGELLEAGRARFGKQDPRTTVPSTP